MINKNGVRPGLNRELRDRCPCRSTLCVRLQWPLCKIVVLAKSFGNHSCYQAHVHEIPFFITSQLHLFILGLGLDQSDSILVLTIFTMASTKTHNPNFTKCDWLRKANSEELQSLLLSQGEHVTDTSLHFALNARG